jgi:hypothetical protein
MLAPTLRAPCSKGPYQVSLLIAGVDIPGDGEVCP